MAVSSRAKRREAISNKGDDIDGRIARLKPGLRLAVYTLRDDTLKVFRFGCLHAPLPRSTSKIAAAQRTCLAMTLEGGVDKLGEILHFVQDDR